MRVCGVEIKANEAILVILESQSGECGPDVVEHATRRIKLDDDENQQRVKDFRRVFDGILRDQRIEKLAIKRRAKKGEYAAGPMSFKIEGLVQLADCEVVFISANAIANFTKKNPCALPLSLKKFQGGAFETARTLLGHLGE